MMETLWPGLAAAVAAGLFQGVFQYEKRKLLRQNQKRAEEISFDRLFSLVKEELYEETKKYLDYKEQSEEYERAKSRCSHLKLALKQCGYGYRSDKTYVIEMIKDIILRLLPSRDAVYAIVPYQETENLSLEDMFDILLYHYEQEYQDKGLETLIEKYQLDRPKNVIENGETPSYIITAEEIRAIYAAENIELSHEEECILLAYKIYRYYKGFGVVDRLRDMAIDGISGGVSGKINEEVGNEFKQKLKNYFWQEREDLLKEQTYRNYDSIWIFFRGKPIHLAFLSFQSEKELRRVCQNIYRYNKAGQLSENIGYKVNDMRDGSRVVVVRPPFSESWAFFVRKFHIKKHNSFFK